jgi:hypothetical protein
VEIIGVLHPVYKISDSLIKMKGIGVEYDLCSKHLLNKGRIAIKEPS